MSTCLSWVCFFVSVVFISTSFQYEGPHGNYSANASGSALQNYNEEKYANSCFCYDQWGKIYNLTPLQNTPLEVQSKTFTGQWYAYNPCSSFKTGPPEGGCQKKEDVAICWWACPGGPDTYRVIGSQSLLTCHVNTKNKYLWYKTSGEFHDHPVKVKLKCDENKTEKADFELLGEGEGEGKGENAQWIFQLTHLCACGDGCPVNPVQPTTTGSGVTTPPNPVDPVSIIVPVGAVGVVLLGIVSFVAYRYVKKRNQDNRDIEERRPILDNGRGDQHPNRIHNPFEEWNAANQARPRPIGASFTKDDANAIRVVRA